jgi:hypothetical protein
MTMSDFSEVVARVVYCPETPDLVPGGFKANGRGGLFATIIERVSPPPEFEYEMVFVPTGLVSRGGFKLVKVDQEAFKNGDPVASIHFPKMRRIWAGTGWTANVDDLRLLWIWRYGGHSWYAMGSGTSTYLFQI